MRLYNSNGLVVVERTRQERETSPESICLDELDFVLIPYLHVSAVCINIIMLCWSAIDRWLPFALSHTSLSINATCHPPRTSPMSGSSASSTIA